MHPHTDRDGSPATGDVVAELLGRGLAIAALGVIALVHVLDLPDAFGETLYLGLLFVLAAALALALAIALSRTGDPRVWLGGDAPPGRVLLRGRADRRFCRPAPPVPLLILLVCVLSRPSGLPAATDDVGNWREPLGL